MAMHTLGKPEVFIVLTSEGKLGVGWQPDSEKGGAEILKWVGEDMIEEAYRALLNRRADYV